MVILPDPDSPFSRSKSYFSNSELILHIHFEGCPPTNPRLLASFLRVKPIFAKRLLQLWLFSCSRSGFKVITVETLTGYNLRKHNFYMKIIRWSFMFVNKSVKEINMVDENSASMGASLRLVSVSAMLHTQTALLHFSAFHTIYTYKSRVSRRMTLEVCNNV